MRARALIGVGLAIGLAIAILGSIALAQPYGGWGMMGGYGPGYGSCMMGGCGYGYGPGMMDGYGMMYGPGYGPGMMGPGWYGGQGNLSLSADNVKNYLERWIAVQGNPRLKVGDVKEKDADTVVIDIVTKDNSLVQRFVVNRHNGYFQASED